MPSKNIKAQMSNVKNTAKAVKKTQTKKVAKTTVINAEVKTQLATKRVGLSVDVYDIRGKVKETMSLPKDIFGAKINKQLISQAVRVYLANQRRGTASTKTRGEVEGSTRKIYRQKGTGRARHGSNRAPIFVHGGIAFGPKPRDYSLKITKDMKKKALFSALSAMQKDKLIKVVDGLEKLEPKTKAFVKVLKSLELLGKKQKILFLLPSKIESLQRASRNIASVTPMIVTQINTYEAMNYKNIIFMKDALDVLVNHFAKEKN